MRYGNNLRPFLCKNTHGKFEEKFIYPYIKDLSSLYLRNSDDIFMIWTGTKNQFDQFFSALNNCHHSIKFDHDISPNEVIFLDTTVYVDNNGALQTKLYKKPTDRHTYLQKRSEHPLPLKDSLAYSQALIKISRGYKLDKILDQVSRERTLKRMLH